jgi:hypothetical protein
MSFSYMVPSVLKNPTGSDPTRLTRDRDLIRAQTRDPLESVGLVRARAKKFEKNLF